MRENTIPPCAASSLIYAASEANADMLYATGLMIPDPFLWLQTPNETLIVISPLEVSRARKLAPESTTVLSTADAAERFGLTSGGKTPIHELIASAAKHFGITAWNVPAAFPLGLAKKLEKSDLTLEPLTEFFPQRRCKGPDEVDKIHQGIILCERGFRRATTILREAQIGPNQVLNWHGEPLTAEILRGEIDAEIARLGGTASHTITAPGKQGADPHQAGYGPIRANEPIVIDIFPRVDSTGYHGDFTRTVLKGCAPNTVKAAYAAVKAAQQAAIAAVRAGVQAKEVHRAASETLIAAGFETSTTAPEPYGFFHGTGHGLGLDVHEAPRVGDNDEPLQEGDVITIEPGLYYPQWGGIRLEDVVVVEKNGCRNLTGSECELEIT